MCVIRNFNATFLVIKMTFLFKLTVNEPKCNIMDNKNNCNTDDITLVVSPQSPDTRWVAIDEDNIIISEGKTPDETIKKAKETGKEFTLMFVPKADNTYFF